VSGDELQAALGGVDPMTGRRLAGREGARRTPGWDLTFSAPKSVSVLYGLGDEGVAKEVATAHSAAVSTGLAYLEEHATVSRRRIDGEIEQVKGEGLVVAAFRYRTRPRTVRHAGKEVARLVARQGTMKAPAGLPGPLTCFLFWHPQP
jgi:conjugative relaxase-like TrwC/TraI family protein